jgi:hypothetical protein
MKTFFKITFFVSFIILSSCSSTKTVSTANSDESSYSSTNRDGSSYEKAIIANSIPEEYQYVKKICQNCQFLGQSLNYDKGKPYDILKFKKPNGDTISYYFDISKFFGKGF